MPIVAADHAVPPFVLALDAGTSSVRSLLFDRRGDAIAGSEAQLPYDLTTTADGGAFVDADMLVNLVCQCIDGTLEHLPAGGEIAAAGMSTFWHGLLGIDASGRPTIPVLLWADTRSARDVDELRMNVDRAALRDLTGCVIHSSYWPAKLRWMRRTEPDAFQRTSRWCSFSDYLLETLTGGDLTSVSMASGTGLLDVRRGTWAEAAVVVAGIEAARLPRIAADGESIDRLRPEFSERWPALRATRWLPGLGDGACANAGAGAFSAERIAVTLGTSGAMRIAIESPSGSSLAIPDDLWAYRLDHRRVIVGAAISNGGKVLSWLCDLLNVDIDGPEVEAAGRLAPDGQGLTVLPFLAGERSPIWNDHATAVIAGMTLSTGRPELLRAGMESVALRFARLYEGVGTVAATPHEIVANGAAILKSPAWLRMTADALGHPLIALDPEEESSARGAAVMALLHAGIMDDPGNVYDPAAGATRIEPNPAHTRRYRQALERQRHLEQLLFTGGRSWDAGFSDR